MGWALVVARCGGPEITARSSRGVMVGGLVTVASDDEGAHALKRHATRHPAVLVRLEPRVVHDRQLRPVRRSPATRRPRRLRGGRRASDARGAGGAGGRRRGRWWSCSGLRPRARAEPVISACTACGRTVTILRVRVRVGVDRSTFVVVLRVRVGIGFDRSIVVVLRVSVGVCIDSSIVVVLRVSVGVRVDRAIVVVLRVGVWIGVDRAVVVLRVRVGIRVVDRIVGHWSSVKV